MVWDVVDFGDAPSTIEDLRAGPGVASSISIAGIAELSPEMVTGSSSAVVSNLSSGPGSAINMCICIVVEVVV